MSRPKILVLGAVGTGGYFGGRLAESGADVTFLVRDGRRKSLSEQGLRIESQFGDAQIEVKTAVAAEVALGGRAAPRRKSGFGPAAGIVIFLKTRRRT